MALESFEKKALTKGNFDASEHLKGLHDGFKSRLDNNKDVYDDLGDNAMDGISDWIGEKLTEKFDFTTVKDNLKQMLDGVGTENGRTLGLKEISNMRINKKYEYQNLNQHAGFAAEVIGTAKDNLEALSKKTGIKTYRADDVPDLFKKNDRFVDKIRVDEKGNILERIQVKFVGKDAKECLSKLTSKRYDKYFNEGKVDKMEVPKDFYNDMKKLIPEKIEKLQHQLEHVNSNGKTDAASKITGKIERLKKIDSMLEKSRVTKSEAIASIRYPGSPEKYIKRIMPVEIAKNANMEGLGEGLSAAALTAAVSTVDNVKNVFTGDMTPEDAVKDIVKDGAVAGGLGYGTNFVSKAVAQAMEGSSHKLIQSAGRLGVPAEIISAGVESFDSFVDFAKGDIDGKTLVNDLGKNVVNTAGGSLGSVAAGAAVGSVVPGAGTIAGAAAGLVGGLAGTALASEAYSTAVKYGPDIAEKLADKARSMAKQTIDDVSREVPEKAGSVKTMLKDFITENHLPFEV